MVQGQRWLRQEVPYKQSRKNEQGPPGQEEERVSPAEGQHVQRPGDQGALLSQDLRRLGYLEGPCQLQGPSRGPRPQTCPWPGTLLSDLKISNHIEEPVKN